MLDGVTFEAVLRRLRESETKVHGLVGTAADGWKSVLGWNPVTTFSGETLEELETFATTEQQAGRLLIGYLSYDFGCRLHNVSLQPKTSSEMPELAVASFANWLEFDEVGAKIMGSSDSFADEVQQILQKPERPTDKPNYSLQPIQNRDWYHQAYQKVADHIVQGDVYQVNLAQLLEGTTTSNPKDLFVSLSADSQAGFQAYLEGDGYEVLSFSPERFIKINQKIITTMPIKGTRPRGASEAEDQALKADLLNNPKDNAELNMITDLLRNDLGEICKVGSVQVSQQRELKAYPTLWHAQATITGQLESDITPIGALARVLPGGSITGCPKKRAIEIINQLEPRRRGLYTGSIFILQPDGRLDSNIAIRTLLKEGEKLSLAVGGGIVYDSTEDAEYQESLDKAAFLTGNASLASDI